MSVEPRPLIDMTRSFLICAFVSLLASCSGPKKTVKRSMVIGNNAPISASCEFIESSRSKQVIGCKLLNKSQKRLTLADDVVSTWSYAANKAKVSANSPSKSLRLASSSKNVKQSRESVYLASKEWDTVISVKGSESALKQSFFVVTADIFDQKKNASIAKIAVPFSSIKNIYQAKIATSMLVGEEAKNRLEALEKLEVLSDKLANCTIALAGVRENQKPQEKKSSFLCRFRSCAPEKKPIQVDKVVKACEDNLSQRQEAIEVEIAKNKEQVEELLAVNEELRVIAAKNEKAEARKDIVTESMILKNEALIVSLKAERARLEIALAEAYAELASSLADLEQLQKKYEEELRKIVKSDPDAPEKFKKSVDSINGNDMNDWREIEEYYPEKIKNNPELVELQKDINVAKDAVRQKQKEADVILEQAKAVVETTFAVENNNDILNEEGLANENPPQDTLKDLVDKTTNVVAEVEKIESGVGFGESATSVSAAREAKICGEGLCDGNDLNSLKKGESIAAISQKDQEEIDKKIASLVSEGTSIEVAKEVAMIEHSAKKEAERAVMDSGSGHSLVGLEAPNLALSQQLDKALAQGLPVAEALSEATAVVASGNDEVILGVDSVVDGELDNDAAKAEVDPETRDLLVATETVYGDKVNENTRYGLDGAEEADDADDSFMSEGSSEGEVTGGDADSASKPSQDTGGQLVEGNDPNDPSAASGMRMDTDVNGETMVGHSPDTEFSDNEPEPAPEPAPEPEPEPEPEPSE